MIMPREARQKKGSSGMWTYLCGWVISIIHLPTLILICLWTSGPVLTKALKKQSDLNPTKMALYQKSSYLVFYIERLQFILITTRRLGSKIIQRLRPPFISGLGFPRRKGVIERNAECQIVFLQSFFFPLTPFAATFSLWFLHLYTMDRVTTSNVLLRYISQLWISLVKHRNILNENIIITIIRSGL